MGTPLTLSKLIQSLWFAPAMHGLIFGATWLTDLAQSQPLLDGPARFGFAILFIGDFPISLVAFSALWDGNFTYALLLWGVLGTVWWYFLGKLISGKLRHRTSV